MNSKQQLYKLINLDDLSRKDANDLMIELVKKMVIVDIIKEHIVCKNNKFYLADIKEKSKEYEILKEWINNGEII